MSFTPCSIYNFFFLSLPASRSLTLHPQYQSSWETRGYSCRNNNMASHGLTYEGCNFFRQRLVLSTLSGKRVKIRNIRSKDDNPGLRGKFKETASSLARYEKFVTSLQYHSCRLLPDVICSNSSPKISVIAVS